MSECPKSLKLFFRNSKVQAMNLNRYDFYEAKKLKFDSGLGEASLKSTDFDFTSTKIKSSLINCTNK